jgi:hypothetical protein
MNGSEMTEHRQVTWATLHLPFHIALLLLVEGGNQFIIWQRILEAVTKPYAEINAIHSVVPEAPTSQDYAKVLNETAMYYMNLYPPDDQLDAFEDVNATITNVAAIPNWFWKLYRTGDSVDNSPLAARFLNDLIEVLYAIVNGIYYSFDIEVPPNLSKPANPVMVQQQQTAALGLRFRLVVSCFFPPSPLK